MEELSQQQKEQLQQQFNLLSLQEQIAKLTIRVSLLEKFLVEKNLLSKEEYKEQLEAAFKVLNETISKLVVKE